MTTALQIGTQTAVTAQASWGERITTVWQKQVSAIIETGNLLIAAQADLGHGHWMRMVKNQLPFGQSTANKLMKIAVCDHFRDSELIPNLPANWAALHQLSLATEEQFAAGLADKNKGICPAMKVKDAKALRALGPKEPDTKRETRLAILERQVKERNHTIAHLQEQLAAAEAGNSFDLRKDSVKNIVSVIVSEVQMGAISRTKALDLANAIKSALSTAKKTKEAAQ